MVSAVLHLDETTPHIHATVVPIVTGERRKAEKEQAAPGKKKYRKKKTNTARLCADDVMSRANLKKYQDTYAAKMQPYGLQRGVEGSEARHVTTSRFYKELFSQQDTIKESIQEDIGILLRQKEAEREQIAELARQQGSIQNAIDLLYDHRDEARQKFDNMERHVRAKNVELKTVGDALEQKRQKLQAMPSDHKQEADQLRTEMAHIFDLFPHVRGLLRWENYLKTIGLTYEWIKALFSLQPYKFTGELTSTEFKQSFHTQDTTLQFRPDKDGPGGFRFTIGGIDDGDWFRQQHSDQIKRLTGIDEEQRPTIKRGIR